MSCHPAKPQFGTAPRRISARVRSGRVAAKTVDRAALTQTEQDGVSEADGVHDGLDLGRSIIQRANLRDRVRQPDPGLVEDEDATERGELLKERFEFGRLLRPRLLR
jgi:hypothetical protein